jgi:D-arabinose 1-dehydrogenase-like Zn-dependent alcohol dehydrogenase
MSARWIDDWGGPLRSGERPRPVPGSEEVLVVVEACGVGLTVLNYLRGDLARGVATTPRIPGHEYVGRIMETGPGVDPRRKGERVLAYFYLFCGSCRRCLAGAESLCERLAGFVGVDVDGGYAPFAVLPARNAIPIADGLEGADATAIPDAIATSLHVAGRASVGPADRVAVIGAGGGVGVHMVQVAKLLGAEVAGLEPGEEKRAYLEGELGVPAFDSRDFGSVRLPPGWGRGADVVIDLVGTRDSLEWAIAAVREDGRVVVLTTFEDVAVPVAPRDLVFRQVSVLGSRYASRHEVALAAELAASGRVRPVVSERVPADDVDALHERLARGDVLGRGALIWDAREGEQR